MRIGFLGTGNMGTPIALRLLAAGHELSVWNRTEERTKPLIHEGAIAAATPAEAELGADAIITVLLDNAAYEEVFYGVHNLIDALSPGLLHILCGTITPAFCQRLTIDHNSRQIELVSAQLIGSPIDAAQGHLQITAAGSNRAILRAHPILSTFAQQITIAGEEPRQAFAFESARKAFVQA